MHVLPTDLSVGVCLFLVLSTDFANCFLRGAKFPMGLVSRIYSSLAQVLVCVCVLVYQFFSLPGIFICMVFILF